MFYFIVNCGNILLINLERWGSFCISRQLLLVGMTRDVKARDQLTGGLCKW